MATNPFDQFDNAANPFDQFDNVSSGSKDDDSLAHKAGKLLDRAFHSAMGVTGPISEAASNFVSGIPSGLAGGFNYLATLGATQNPDAAMAVKHGTEQAIGDKTQYTPTSDLGKKAVDALNTGFQKVIEAGGPAFENTIKSIPFVGSDLASNHEAMDAMGKAYTEMALNVAPIHEVGGLLKRGRSAESAVVKPILDDPREAKAEPAAAHSAPNPFDQFDTGTTAHADDFAAINPFDTAGHVTDLEQGRPATIDNAQPDLFGSQILEDSQPVPQVGQESIVHDSIPYEKTFPFDLEPMDQTPMEPQMGLNMPEADVTGDLVPKDAIGGRELADSPMRNFFLDPRNMDKVDFHSDHGFAEEALGDKSLMSPDQSATMAEHLANGRIDDALSTIAMNHENVAYRNLADYLKGKLDGLNVVVHPEGILELGDRQATGYYDPTTRTIGFSKVGAVSPHTVLHEMVHAMTSDFINTRPNDLRVMGIKDLFNKLNDMGMAKDFPSIVNPKEFLAEAFSNPEFQQYLKEHRIQSRSTWRRFVDNVKSMLGFSSATRNAITDALEHTIDLGKQVMDAKPDNGMQAMKDAGVPSKLADLMVTRQPEKPNQVVQYENMKALTGPAKVGAQWDFTPLKPEEVIPMARTAPDIPASTLETIKANLDAGGRFASLRHNNNPVVKYTFAYVDHAVKQYEKWIRDNITNKNTGLKSKLQNLSSDDFTAVHQQLMLDEGAIERTPQQYRELGWSEPMIDAAIQLRQIGRDMIDRVNEVRAQLNPPLPPVDYRMGHLAGRFLGDFNHMVYERNADGTRGKAVMRLTGSTKWGAQDLADFVAKEHPEWEVDKQEYNALRPDHTPDRFSGFTEMLNYVSKHDPVVAKALDSLDKYNRAAAQKYLNAMRHAKDKQVQPGGIIGSEGHKFWVDAKTNAEQGFKGHLAYLDTSAKWIEMQKAMENISKVTSDLEVTKQQPNAIKWSMAYTDHALHRNQGFLTKMASSLLSEVGRVFGVGHSNITRGINAASTTIMRNWMGIGNIPFALKHMLLPFQKMPAMMTYLKTIPDLETRMGMSGLKSLTSYYHYLKDAPQDAFDKQAFQYAKDNNVFNVSLDNLSGRIQSGKTRQILGKLADIDFSGPEHAIRGNSFFFYAHLLHDAGMSPESAFSAAEHMTKALYTDYSAHEAPRAAAKAGWIGQLAFQITRYKANEISQLGFFNRERLTGDDHTFMQKMMSNTPLMVHIGSLLAFSGITGMLGFKEMDEAYSVFRKWMMNSPDNLTALMQRTNVPDLWKYGIFSKIGIDPKISEAELLPSPFPTTAAEINMMGLAFNAARYHDKFHMQQLALGLAPSTARGPLENMMFTQPKATTGPNAGKSLYLNPNTGEGRYARDDHELFLRDLGFHSTAETNELENNFAMKRVDNDNKDLAEHILDKAKGLMASGSLTQEAAQDLARQYAQHQQAGQPDFGTELVLYARARMTSQRQQMELKAANDRMGNTATTLMRNR